MVHEAQCLMLAGVVAHLHLSCIGKLNGGIKSIYRSSTTGFANSEGSEHPPTKLCHLIHFVSLNRCLKEGEKRMMVLRDGTR